MENDYLPRGADQGRSAREIYNAWKPALVAVMLNDCHARFTYPDGKTEEITAKAGQVAYYPALDHLPENLSDKLFDVIGIELKGGPWFRRVFRRGGMRPHSA